MESVRFGLTGDRIETFRELAKGDQLDFSAITVGTPDHLAVPYMCISTSRDLLLKLAHAAEDLGHRLGRRAHAAGLNLHVAAESLFSALVLHLRPYRMACCNSIGLSRVAIEATALAYWIAAGTGQEITQWEDNKRPRVPKSEHLKNLDTFLAKARRPMPASQNAYRWMCGFAHADYASVKNVQQLAVEALHSYSYAAIAYASLALSLVSEFVIGWEGLAQWPLAWPSELDWGAAFLCP